MVAKFWKLFHFPEAHFIVLVIVVADIGPTSSPELFRERGWHEVSLIQSTTTLVHWAVKIKNISVIHYKTEPKAAFISECFYALLQEGKRKKKLKENQAVFLR